MTKITETIEVPQFEGFEYTGMGFCTQGCWWWPLGVAVEPSVKYPNQSIVTLNQSIIMFLYKKSEPPVQYSTLHWYPISRINEIPFRAALRRLVAQGNYAEIEIITSTASKGIYRSQRYSCLLDFKDSHKDRPQEFAILY
jgi:hypothetical protein